MSKVKITGHASGSGTLTLTGPNTNSDRTITLPDETGTVALGVGIDDNADATAITIDSSENVGIGTIVPYTTAKLNVAGLTSTSTTAYNSTNPPASGQLDIRSSDAYGTQLGGKLTFSGNSGESGGVALSVYGAIQGVKTNTTINNAGGGLSLSTTINSSGLLTERLLIAEDGSFIFGQATGDIQGANSELTLTNNTNFYCISNNSRLTSVSERQTFRSQGTQIGAITAGGSSTSYGTSSDYRVKENVNYTWDATTRLKQLKPVRFNWIADETNTLVDGFIAHEAAEVVPESIFGTKDAMAVETRYTESDVETQGGSPTKSVGDVKTYSSSEIQPQQIDQSKLVPLLVKTIQELEARITVLEG